MLHDLRVFYNQLSPAFITFYFSRMGWDWSFGHMPYGLCKALYSLRNQLIREQGKEWKVHRRMFYRQFQQSAVPTHWPVQRTEVHALLRRMLHSPQDLIEHLRQYIFPGINFVSLRSSSFVGSNAASFIMNLTYGIHIAPENDRYITMAEAALAGMSEAAKPGAFLVDFLPFCTCNLS
jgi:hypothetical protein